jgi:hypothetical protein
LQFKVPQNIDMQDKILGPLTMLQFVYAVVGFGTCYAIYVSIPKPFSIILILPIAFFVVCLDFIKVNERPFLDFFIALVEFIASPKQRFWHQDTGSDMKVEIYHIDKSNQPANQHKDVSNAQIETMAKSFDDDDNQLIRK